MANPYYKDKGRSYIFVMVSEYKVIVWNWDKVRWDEFLIHNEY